MLTNRQLFQLHLGQTSPAPLMLEIEKAEGVWLFGTGGKKYIDLISGVSVSNTGHRHPKVVAAIKDQVDSYLHLMVYGEIIQSPQVKYAEKLSSLLPEYLSSVYFVNSGSEAIEGALKLAKRYTGKSKIVYFANSYHGSTHAALSIQGSPVYKSAFLPLLPDTWQIPFNDFSALDIIDDKCACVIIEPVQAEAGVIYPVEGWLGEIRRRCTDSGTMLIFDEVQTGFGRTGDLFAINKFGIIPDILVLAKALGGGMPLGAFISSKKIMDTLTFNPPLGHITTFGGHPVCCAAGLASLEVIVDENLASLSRSKEKLFRQLLLHEMISEIRGEGLLLAVQLKNNEYIPWIIEHAPEYGLLLDYFLFNPGSFRIAPPLIISNDEITEACSRLKKLLDDAASKVEIR
jgi:acetylornithine/N-succinyldiaminopimelate aminotransferase